MANEGARAVIRGIVGRNELGIWSDYDRRFKQQKHRIRVMTYDEVKAAADAPKIAAALAARGYPVLSVSYDNKDSIRVVLALNDEG